MIIMEQIIIYLLTVQKLLDLKVYPLCLGNISKNVSIDNMKKTRLHGYVYNFSVDYDATAVADILDIHKYLIKKHDIK